MQASREQTGGVRSQYSLDPRLMALMPLASLIPFSENLLASRKMGAVGEMLHRVKQMLISDRFARRQRERWPPVSWGVIKIVLHSSLLPAHPGCLSRLPKGLDIGRRFLLWTTTPTRRSRSKPKSATRSSPGRSTRPNQSRMSGWLPMGLVTGSTADFIERMGAGGDREGDRRIYPNL